MRPNVIRTALGRTMKLTPRQRSAWRKRFSGKGGRRPAAGCNPVPLTYRTVRRSRNAVLAAIPLAHLRERPSDAARVRDLHCPTRNRIGSIEVRLVVRGADQFVDD
jgi:hypothetical protein